MSAWDKDIQEYCRSREKDPAKVKGILMREGWDSSNYSTSMKADLFDWLDQWYTLSIKNLPTPATRRNPLTKTAYRRLTRLPEGSVLTSLARGKYLTQMLSGTQQYVKIDTTQAEADETHLEFVERILYD